MNKYDKTKKGNVVSETKYESEKMVKEDLAEKNIFKICVG